MDAAERFFEEFLKVKSCKYMHRLSSTAQGECAIIHFLQKSGEPVNSGAISANLGVSSARVAVALKALTQKGLIRTYADDKDKRKTFAQLTQKGEETAQERKEALLSIIRKVEVKLGKEDSETAVRLMEKITDILMEESLYEQLS